MEKSETMIKIEKSLRMTFPQFVMKLFGYETRIIEIKHKKTQKTDYVEKYVKVHKSIFKEVFYNGVTIFMEWFRLKFIGPDHRIMINPKLIEWTVKNPMNQEMKSGHIEPPEYNLKKE